MAHIELLLNVQVLKILSHLLYLVTQLPRLPVTELPLRNDILFTLSSSQDHC